MSRKYFGTDGIRGLVGEFPIVPEFALKLGWAAGKVLASQGNPSVVIGKDTRLSGYMLESALQSGLCAAGVSVRLLGPMPTPAVAHLARAFHASAGIVISPHIILITIMVLSFLVQQVKNCQTRLSSKSKSGSINQCLLIILMN
jgi:phosphomannomutase